MTFAQGALDGSLKSPPTDDAKQEIIKELWGIGSPKGQPCVGGINCNPFFQYYYDRCTDALHDRGRHTSARSHRDILEIAQHLKDGLARHEIQHLLRPKLSKPMPNEDELLNGA